MFDDGPKAVNQHTIYSCVSETFQKFTDTDPRGDRNAPECRREGFAARKLKETAYGFLTL
jgi:hypothetical protein